VTPSRLDHLIPAAIFLVGVTAFAVALAYRFVPSPVVPAPTPITASHHVLVSPYQAQLFLHGQASMESNRGSGRGQPRDMSQAYEQRGYEWVALTDVNTPAPVNVFEIPGQVALPGDRASYPFGQFLAYGISFHENAATPQDAVDWIHRAAGVAVLAHPLEAPSIGLEGASNLRQLDGVEVYDARLALDRPQLADATSFWDALLTAGHHVWGIASDDAIDVRGRDSTLGQTYLDVQASKSKAQVADAIKRGAFVTGTSVRVLGISAVGDSITVTTTDATSITFYGKGGRQLASVDGRSATFKVNWSEGYVRAVARNPGGQAWIQPTWVVP
jgi:hypothetical protein